LGIACDPLSNASSSSLFDKQLKGIITPFLGNLSSLQVLDLTLNSFTGSIPAQLGLCSSFPAPSQHLVHTQERTRLPEEAAQHVLASSCPEGPETFSPSANEEYKCLKNIKKNVNTGK
jgi:hypothetical protein